MIDVNLVCLSTNIAGFKIATFILEYPRYIHSQVLTHRLFSRNVSSSRAIPVIKTIEHIKETPVVPEKWGLNRKGMFSVEELDARTSAEATGVWLAAMDAAIEFAEKLSDLGVHKQHANRLLEPFMHVKTILTATDFENFFAQRLAHDAQPEIQELARKMCAALEETRPTVVDPGSWHIPMLLESEQELPLKDQLKVSAARCARVSYRGYDTHEVSMLGNDIELAQRLRDDAHMSPFEHQAVALAGGHRVANYRGWMQYRVLLDRRNPE